MPGVYERAQRVRKRREIKQIDEAPAKFKEFKVESAESRAHGARDRE